MLKFIRHNGLSLTFLLLFVFSIAGQTYFGLQEYNKERVEQGEPSIAARAYFTSGHFIESTFENWQSEFCRCLLL